jgi:hypothetical protein
VNKAGGDIQWLANLINNSLQHASSDLSPLSDIATYEIEPISPEYIIRPYEVFRKLSQIKTRKSPGPDGIPNWFLRDFAFAISEPICHIFNASVQHGTVPACWKMANVIPIPKVRPPKSLHDDLRPISLTPTLSKILESFIGQRMLSVCKFDRRQYGALKGRSTTHALIDILHTWHQALDDRNSARVLFIDFSKAFDHVDHTTVLDKMASLGVLPPFILRWMHSFLHESKQQVKIGNTVSSWTTMNGGMPQGT